MQKELFKSKYGSLPPLFNQESVKEEDEEEEGIKEGEKEQQQQSVDDNSVLRLPKGPFKSKNKSSESKLPLSPEESFNARHWNKYFDNMRDIIIPESNNIFRVYESGKSGPLFVLLHGGGHTSLSWALVSEQLRLTCQVLAYDCRGHGNTITDDDSNLSAEQMIEDFFSLLNVLYPSGTEIPPIIMCGHSMGGSMAVKISTTGRVPNQVGLIVVDVVEGTALSALASMHSVIERRPVSFETLNKAIEWSYTSGTLRNLASAKISIPSQLMQVDEDGKVKIGVDYSSLEESVSSEIPSEKSAEIKERELKHSQNITKGRVFKTGKWYWRTKLYETEPYWKGWFTNLSQEFLSVRGAKMLLLAGTDRLDKHLTIGQMQGKFQLSILPKVGHVIMEDDPTNTVNTFLDFVRRNRWL